MSKAMFLVQYYPYQYEQFQLLADELGADVFYKNDLRVVGRKVDSKLVYDLDGNPYTLEDIQSKNYDYLLYTGPAKSYIEKLSKMTRYHFTVYLSHSLMGTQYDTKISMAPYDRSIGIMPKLWTSFDSFAHLKVLYQENGWNWRFIESSSNPIVAQSLSYQPKVSVIPGSLGLVLGEKSPFETSIIDILSNKDRLGINKVFIKFHPLTEKADMDLFKCNPIFEILPTHDTHKYDFTDRCEYLVGGASSLLIEASLRNKYYNLGQKFMKLNIKRGVDIDLPTLWNYDLNNQKEFTLYDSMIMSPSDIINEHINLIHYIEDNFI